MTEKEAIIRFEFIRCALLAGTKPHIVPNEENIALIDVAIRALEGGVAIPGTGNGS